MLQSFRNNLMWITFGSTSSVVFGLLIAVLADRSSFEKVAKSFIFLPMAISLWALASSGTSSTSTGHDHAADRPLERDRAQPGGTPPSLAPMGRRRAME